jgi:hypothetical protein
MKRNLTERSWQSVESLGYALDDLVTAVRPPARTTDFSSSLDCALTVSGTHPEGTRACFPRFRTTRA